MAQNGSLWGASVSPGPREKKASKQSEGDITDSSPRLPGTCRTAHLPTLTLGKAM